MERVRWFAKTVDERGVVSYHLRRRFRGRVYGYDLSLSPITTRADAAWELLSARLVLRRHLEGQRARMARSNGSDLPFVPSFFR